jgi:endogenous inhibitor of DNA gyrase (YacG/DUF329 family)
MSEPAAPTDFPEKWVACPQCGGPSLYAPHNAFRPFCSQSCKQLDLGAWASEQFAVPAQPGPDDTPSDAH